MGSKGGRRARSVIRVTPGVVGNALVGIRRADEPDVRRISRNRGRESTTGAGCVGLLVLWFAAAGSMPVPRDEIDPTPPPQSVVGADVVTCSAWANFNVQ